MCVSVLGLHTSKYLRTGCGFVVAIYAFVGFGGGRSIAKYCVPNERYSSLTLHAFEL